jgi:hypothetical protein
MAPQGLQIRPPQDSLARLGVIADGIIIINIMFCICIAGCRSTPVRIQGFAYLLFFHGLSGCLFV